MCAEHAMLLYLNTTLRAQQINADVLNVRAGRSHLSLSLSRSREQRTLLWRENKIFSEEYYAYDSIYISVNIIGRRA